MKRKEANRLWNKVKDCPHPTVPGLTIGEYTEMYDSLNRKMLDLILIGFAIGIVFSMLIGCLSGLAMG